MKVYQAINAVQAALAREGIAKDRKNEMQGYKFRGIDEVYNALAPLLAKHGLCILPRCTERVCVERTNAKGTALFYVTVRADFDFVCSEDGSKHTITTYGEAMDSGDKATNKAMSAAYKYAAMQAFSIPTEGDNDADAQTHEVEPHLARQLEASIEMAKESHSPTRLAFASLQPDIQDNLRKAAPFITAAMPDCNKAIELIEVTLDNWPDEDRNNLKSGLWYLLDSKTRSAIKRHTQESALRGMKEAA